MSIYVFNCKSRSGFLLPSVTVFNNSSTHYGKVMLPRANGLIVTYPNNSKKAYVYNTKEKTFINTEDLKTFLKTLKKNDIIEKYKEEGQVRINKQWLTLGNHFGAGVYELYNDLGLFGFLNTSNGTVWDVTHYNYLGGYCNGNFELLEGKEQFWMDTEGLRTEHNIDENGTYKGISRFIKLDNGQYIIKQNRNGKDYLILGENALLNQKQFVVEAPK